MEFSNALKENGPHAWSPDGSMLATCDANRLYIRDTSTLMAITILTNVDVVSRIEWSPDGRYILCKISCPLTPLSQASRCENRCPGVRSAVAPNSVMEGRNGAALSPEMGVFAPPSPFVKNV